MLASKTVAALAALVAISRAQIPPIAETTVVIIDKVPAVAVRTVYATSHITVFGCPPWEENCPVRDGETQAVVTATIGATTTVCPLTLSQARLSVRQGISRNTGGPLETSTTTWPTVYNLPSEFPTQTTWDPAIWASIFPSGAPAFSDPVSTGSFADGEWTGTPFPLPTLNAEQAAIFGGDGSASSNGTGGSYNGSAAGGAAGGASSGQSVTVTTGSFAAIFSSNMTAYVTTLNAFTGNWSAGGPGATGGYNGSGSLPGSPTTLSNGTVVGTGPVSLQTVNVSPAIPVNLFSLLVALSALAFAL